MKQKLLYSALLLSIFTPYTQAETVASLEKKVTTARDWYQLNEYGGLTGEEACLNNPGLTFNDPGWPGCWPPNRSQPAWATKGQLCSDGHITFGYAFHQPPCEERVTYVCPDSSWTLSADKQTCYRPDAAETVNAGAPSCNVSAATAQFIGNPINIGTGNKLEQQTDLSVPAYPALTFSRIYNSRYLPATGSFHPWRHNFQQSIVTDPDGQTVSAYRHNGKIQQFRQSGTTWTAVGSTHDTLQARQNADGQHIGWTYAITAEGREETYNIDGRLMKIAYLSGESLTLTYSDGQHGESYTPSGNKTGKLLPAGLLTQVTNSIGLALTLGYDEYDRQIFVADPANVKVGYGYDSHNRLIVVKQPGGGYRRYLYEDETNLNALTGIVDEAGVRTLTVQYDDQGRAISTEHAGGTDRFQVTYHQDGSVSAIDPLGTSRTYRFANIQNEIKTTEQTQPCPNGCSQSGKATTYDALGNATRIVDWNGSVREYAYDPVRGLELRRTEGLKDNGGVSDVQPETRTIVTDWHTSLPLPIEISIYSGGVTQNGQPDGGLQTRSLYAYDAQGNLITHTEQDASQNSRVWRYTYQSLGRLSSEQGPDGQITRYSYHPDDDRHLGNRGRLHRIDNGQWVNTEITDYTVDGRPRRILNENGLETHLTYDARGRLTNRETGTIAEYYEYDAAGRPLYQIRNDGTFKRYNYDDTGRQVSTQDQRSKITSYTLDAYGNRIIEDSRDPSGSALGRIERTYSPLNQLNKITGLAE